jgi:hypothetical protein
VNAYPPGLPCVARASHGALAAAAVVRTPMEAGNARQRRTQRTLPHLLTLSWDLEQPHDLAAWMTWVNAFAWADWFTLRLPGLVASRAGLTSADVPVRFVSDVRRELWQGRGLWGWRVSVTAVYQPTTADLASVPLGPWIVAGMPATPSADWIVAGTPAVPSLDLVSAGTPPDPSAYA